LPYGPRSRAQPEADAARGAGRGPLLPWDRQLGALARILRRGTRRGYVALRLGLAAWRLRLARKRRADGRTTPAVRERQVQDPGRECSPPLSALARLVSR